MRPKIQAKIKNATILITGGTGSFGNTVVSLLLKQNPKKIIIFSRDEKKQFDMRNSYNSLLLKFVIGDVRNLDLVRKIMEGVDFVFHAAALKQVPTCEFFPLEAIKTNILGSYNVIQAAIEKKVKKVVLLSTDKAVYPINVVGLTKSLMEKIMIAEAKNYEEMKKGKTVICAVRYGNVLYTRGSVIPFFVEQIKQNKLLSITDAKMTRFLLPLTDAVDLVLFALTEGKNGYVYVRKSKAATLETMAKALCEIFKYRPGYGEVGIRAGEKIHETLVSQEEMFRAENLGKYYAIPAESQGLDYNSYFFKGKKNVKREQAAFTSETTKRLSIRETKDVLLQLPEIKKEQESMLRKKKEAHI